MFYNKNWYPLAFVLKIRYVFTFVRQNDRKLYNFMLCSQNWYTPAFCIRNTLCFRIFSTKRSQYAHSMFLWRTDNHPLFTLEIRYVFAFDRQNDHKLHNFIFFSKNWCTPGFCIENTTGFHICWTKRSETNGFHVFQ